MVESAGRNRACLISDFAADAEIAAWHFTHASDPTKSLFVGKVLVGHQPGWATRSRVLIRSATDAGVLAACVIRANARSASGRSTSQSGGLSHRRNNNRKNHPLVYRESTPERGRHSPSERFVPRFQPARDASSVPTFTAVVIPVM